MRKKIEAKARKIVYKLREKPEKERRDILHLLMIVSGAFMFGLWVLSLTIGSGGSAPKEAKVKNSRGLEPFNVLRDNLISGFESIQANTSAIVE